MFQSVSGKEPSFIILEEGLTWKSATKLTAVILPPDEVVSSLFITFQLPLCPSTSLLIVTRVSLPDVTAFQADPCAKSEADLTSKASLAAEAEVAPVPPKLTGMVDRLIVPSVLERPEPVTDIAFCAKLFEKNLLLEPSVTLSVFISD